MQVEGKNLLSTIAEGAGAVNGDGGWR